MEVEVVFSNGESGEFDVESVQVTNDVALLDGVLHTNVETVEVSG